MAGPELKRASELICPINCTVKSVNGCSRKVYDTPLSELVVGREAPNHDSGQNLNLEISVESADAPAVKKIKFPGWPHIEKGDVIKAYVLKGEEKCPRWQSGEKLYAARDFKEQEHALKIEILRDNEVVANYFA